MRALCSDGQNCSRNVSEKFQRTKRLSDHWPTGIGEVRISSDDSHAQDGPGTEPEPETGTIGTIFQQCAY